MPTRRGRQRWTSALPANQPSTAALRSLTADADATRDVHLAARLSLGRDVLLVGPSNPDDGFGGWRAGLGSWLADNGFEVKGSGATRPATSLTPALGGQPNHDGAQHVADQ